MWSRRNVLQLPALFQVGKSAAGSDREYWVSTLHRIKPNPC